MDGAEDGGTVCRLFVVCPRSAERCGYWDERVGCTEPYGARP